MRRGWTVWALGWLGCTTPTLPLEIGPDEQVAYVALDQSGELRVGLTGLLDGPLSFELIGVDEVAFFTIPAGGLFDGVGSLAGERGQQVRAQLQSESTGEGCGRCLAPSRTWPQALLPGDRCPIPKEAPGRLFVGEGRGLVEASPEGAALARLRGVLALTRTGPCACDDFPSRSLDGLELRLDDHPEAALPLRALTDRADGHLYGFLPGQIFHYDAATGQAERFVDPLPSDAPPLASTIAADGALVVSRKDPARPFLESSLHRLERVGDGWRATPLSLPSTARIEVLRRPEGDPHRRLFAGGVTRMVTDAFTKLFRCAEDGSQCVAEFLDVPQDDRLLGIEVRGDGVLHAYLSRGIFTQLRPNDAFLFSTVQGFFSYQGRQHEVRDWSRVRFGAQRAVGCARLEPQGRAIVSVPYAANGAVDFSRMEITYANLELNSGCFGVVHQGDGFFAWLQAGEVGQYLTLDALGQVTASAAEPPWSTPIQDLSRLEQGTFFGADQGAGGYWGTGLDDLRKIHGQADPRLGAIISLLVDGERVIAVSQGGRLRVVEASGTRTIPDPNGLVPASLLITGAAVDESWPGPGRSLLVAERQGMARLNFDQVIESFEWLEPRVEAVAVAYSAPDAFVHVDRRGRMIRTVAGSRTELPYTFEPGGPGDLFRVFMAQRGGVVWAASDEGRLFRGVGDHFEAFSPDAPSVTYGDLVMACPDRAWITANSGDGRGVVTVYSEGDAAPQPKLILAPIAARPLQTILEDGEGHAFFDEDGVMHRPSGGQGLRALWTPATRGVVTPQLVVVGGGEGVLFVGRR